ncbi:MAG: serine/threonine protein kinase [Polyangiaceae bacterium]|nr:serine/threonine protein kinase [Polyangiaceae bacterium]
MAAVPVQPGDILADKYEVERILGEGGMGVVVAARHLDLDQRVAVKFLLAEVAEHRDAAERFRREARAAAKITSEHVARVIDVGSTDDGLPYMVMEYLDGRDLSDLLQADGPLEPTLAVDYVLQACQAVAEAHRAGIVHRDLKPANLFLHRKADGSSVIKVLDFGISKSVGGASATDLSLTSTAALIGSPLYMSPEQMHSARSVDVRTDIWALGAILYQLLSGRPPFVAESLPQLCSALINDVPPALHELRPEVPVELERAVMGALVKDREGRYPSVLAFAEALAPFGAGDAPQHLLTVQRLSRTDGELAPTAPAIRSAEATALTLPAAGGDVATQSAWGRTGDATVVEGAPRRRWAGAWVVAGLVAAALIAFGISRTSASAEPADGEAATAASVTPAPPAEPALPVEPAPRSTSAQPPPVAEPAPLAADAAAATVAPTPKPVRPPRAPQVKPPTTSTPVPTDFGGRR